MGENSHGRLNLRAGLPRDYAGLPGPQYETPAEVRMLRKMGAEAIGMYTVLEVIQARDSDWKWRRFPA